jgi:hypothetical protein
MVNSRNTSSGRRDFATSCKQGAGFEITRKDWNTDDSRKKRAYILKLNNLNHYA